MKTILLGLSLVAMVSGCANVQVVEQTRSSVSVCCPNGNVVCSSDDLAEKATAVCGSNASWVKSYTRDSGAFIMPVGATYQAHTSQSQCAQYNCR